MKSLKFFAILAISAVSALTASAQSTTPRYYGPNNNNTGSGLNYNWIAKTEATGNDTLKVVPTAYYTTIRATLAADSLGINVTSIANSFAGDKMQIIASGASGTKITFKGSNFQTAGTATLSTGLFAVISLVFSGTKWVEVSRVVQ